jgi:hypothetical protein
MRVRREPFRIRVHWPRLARACASSTVQPHVGRAPDALDGNGEHEGADKHQLRVVEVGPARELLYAR